MLIVPILLVQLLVQLQLGLVLQALKLILMLALQNLRLQLVLDHFGGLRLLDLTLHVILQVCLLILDLLSIQVNQSELVLLLVAHPADSLGSQRSHSLVLGILLLLPHDVLSALLDGAVLNLDAALESVPIHLLVHHSILFSLHALF